MQVKKSARRPRRTAEEARRRILDAAEQRLADAGPDGIRLQQIAADVGVSHPAILHHFGNREGLIRAVVERAMQSLERDLLQALRDSAGARQGTANAMLELVARTLGDRGHARVMAWLMLTGHREEPQELRIRTIAVAAHKERTAASTAADTPSFEDTLFRTLLIALALFGDAIAGPAMRASAGLGDDPDTARRFRRWLAELLTEGSVTRGPRRPR